MGGGKKKKVGKKRGNGRQKRKWAPVFLEGKI